MYYLLYCLSDLSSYHLTIYLFQLYTCWKMYHKIINAKYCSMCKKMCQLYVSKRTWNITTKFWKESLTGNFSATLFFLRLYAKIFQKISFSKFYFFVWFTYQNWMSVKSHTYTLIRKMKTKIVINRNRLTGWKK